MELKLGPLKNGWYLLVLASLSSEECGTQTRRSPVPADVLEADPTKQVLNVRKTANWIQLLLWEATVTAGMKKRCWDDSPTTRRQRGRSKSLPLSASQPPSALQLRWHKLA